MIKTVLSCALFSMAVTAAPVLGGTLVGYEDFDGGAFGLVTSVVPALDGGGGDYFGTGSRNAWPQGFPTPGVPFSLGDDSVIDYSGGGMFAADAEGVFGQNSDFDNTFFAISDSDEFGADQTASWTFDVTGITDINVIIDFGGISDAAFDGYSLDSSIVFVASFDNGPGQTVFDISAVDNPGFVTRPMDGGGASGGGRLLEVSGDAAITKTLAEGGVAGNTYLDKTPADGPSAGVLDSFSTPILGSGNELTLTLTANLPFEGAVFDNIQIVGVPEPTSVGLLAAGCVVALVRRRK